MTASTTRSWRRGLEAACWLVGLLWCLLVHAGSIEPRSAELIPDETGYAVNAEFAVNIGPRLEEAVARGVPLFFRFEIQIKRKRWYWIDEHLAGRVLKYRLSYQALTRQYRLTLGSLHQNFERLDEALAVLGRIRRLHVADRGVLPVGEPLVAAVRLSLDHSQLPKPLQVDALADAEWRVEAPTHTWQFSLPAETK